MDEIVDHAADLSGAEREAIADDVARFVETSRRAAWSSLTPSG